ncbi:MAG: hypothetical protein IT442_07215, partial [Phycisphaeraceae bacterium]|nr:hypothetical protein [Phycisphaeraceae bacterium]
MPTLINLLIFLPLVGGLACLITPTPAAARRTALATSIVTLLISILVAFGYYSQGYSGVQFVTSVPWITSIGVEYRTGVDGLSLPLVLLTTALSVLVVAASWGIAKAARSYLALYMFLLSGMLGVFLALDLFLFYVFFEVSLVPMYFLIGIWGGPRKEYAAIKFFLYTLFGSICLLIVMLGIYFFTPEAVGATGNTWDMIRLQTDPNILAL